MADADSVHNRSTEKILHPDDEDLGEVSDETDEDGSISCSVSDTTDEMAQVVQVLQEDRKHLKLMNNHADMVNVEDLPLDIQRKIRALKKNQIEVTKVEARFYQGMHELECKYLNEMKEHFDKRRDIVTGAYEPTDEDCDFSVGSAEQKVSNVSEKTEEDKQKPLASNEPGLPYFWTTIFHNIDLLDLMTDEGDDPILKHLFDIEIEMMKDPMGFKLHFCFSPNEYFTNAVLTKTYLMKCELDLEDPFSYEGTEIYKCTGCTIDWKEGKNVTVKVINKKQKHKQSGTIRTITKTIKAQSFFHFFDPPIVPENAIEELDEDMQQTITADFEIGQYIRERIVPRAVLYFTGEAVDDSFDESKEEEDNSLEEESESEEDLAFQGAQGDHVIPLSAE